MAECGVTADVRPAQVEDRRYVALLIDGEIKVLMPPEFALAYAKEIQRMALWATEPAQRPMN